MCIYAYVYGMCVRYVYMYRLMYESILSHPWDLTSGFGLLSGNWQRQRQLVAEPGSETPQSTAYLSITSVIP